MLKLVSLCPLRFVMAALETVQSVHLTPAAARKYADLRLLFPVLDVKLGQIEIPAARAKDCKHALDNELDDDSLSLEELEPTVRDITMQRRSMPRTSYIVATLFNLHALYPFTPHLYT
ncbi:hypothetical protein F5882DRAFT_387614 [Hyaloscypha sp. PMI_1271]|nr:hypothetical protein F5882DRAFT_387614 [Hyaloscypha sp. PMI_1271]